MLQRRNEYDVDFASVDEAGAVLEIVSCLESKGFCVLKPGIVERDLQQARIDIEDCDLLGKLYQPPELVVEGLLGTEGSARIMELERPDPDTTEFRGLNRLDETMTEVAAMMEECALPLGFSCPTRTTGILHETGLPGDVASDPELEEAATWLETFKRHRLMIILCLGPVKGTLELRPFDDDAEPYEITTAAGSVVVLRCDAMTHRHFAHSKALMLSCFLLESKPAGKTKEAWFELYSVPVAREVHTWIMQKMKELKEAEYEYSQPANIPDSWTVAMNHNFNCVQRVAVRGMAARYCSSWDVATWFKVQCSAVDFVTEIPVTRWQADEYYDSDPECWRWNKSYLKHGSFIDGAEYFDSRFFGLSPAEAGGMDPHQREVLEVGYEALRAAGYSKGMIMNSLGGVYVGSSMTVFGLVAEGVGATGAAASITSNRFSFCLGIKGPSMTVDTEGASSLSAVYCGAEALLDKGRGVTNLYSVCGGVALQLGTVFWPQLQSAGLLSAKGRCMTWDQCADGYCMGDGCGFVVLKRLTEMQDGQQVLVEGEPTYGQVAACKMNSNGIHATLGTPSGPAEQELVAETIRSGGLSPLNIDAVECHGQGAFMPDAVEVNALLRVLRSEDVDEPQPLTLTSVKSVLGNGNECSGIISLQRALLSNVWGTSLPSLHLWQVNPYIEPERGANFTTGCCEFPLTASYAGVTSRGFTGTNVHAIAYGEVDENRLMPLPRDTQRDCITFWPGGGGELEEGVEPRRGYSVMGTWNRWLPEAMRHEGAGTYSCVVTLGENRWEDFQILLDGDKAKCLHPALPKAYKGAAVCGPDLTVRVRGLNWRISGSETEKSVGVAPTEEAVATSETEPGLRIVPAGTPDVGVAGDGYRILLQIAGKYRSVTWERIGGGDGSAPEGDYFVASSWNGWSFDRMSKESDGSWVLEVHVLYGNGQFQIVRNEDWNQVICPAAPAADASMPGYGPDDGFSTRGCTWLLDADVGDVVRISLQRNAEQWTVSWSRVRQEPLSEAQLLASKRTRLAVVGSWTGWAEQSLLSLSGGSTAQEPSLQYFFLQIGPEGQESFQLLRDCDWSQVFHPSVPVCGLGVPHFTMLSPGGATVDLVWIIGPEDGAAPGAIFQVSVHEDCGRVVKVTWSRTEPTSEHQVLGQ